MKMTPETREKFLKLPKKIVVEYLKKLNKNIDYKKSIKKSYK